MSGRGGLPADPVADAPPDPACASRSPFRGFSGSLEVAFAAAAFYVLYAGSWYVTSQRHDRATVPFLGEESIPFSPEWAWVYLAGGLFSGLAPVFLKTARDLRPWIGTILAETVLAVAIYLVWPVSSGWTRPPPNELTGCLRWVDLLNLDFNECPSLHVAITWTSAVAYSRAVPLWARGPLFVFAMAVSLSTLFIHEHQLLDVLGGLFLAAVGVWGIYPHLDRTMTYRDHGVQPSAGDSP